MSEARYVLAAVAIVSAGAALITAPGSYSDAWRRFGDFQTGATPVYQGRSQLGPIYAAPVARASALKGTVPATATTGWISLASALSIPGVTSTSTVVVVGSAPSSSTTTKATSTRDSARRPSQRATTNHQTATHARTQTSQASLGSAGTASNDSPKSSDKAKRTEGGSRTSNHQKVTRAHMGQHSAYHKANDRSDNHSGGNGQD